MVELVTYALTLVVVYVNVAKTKKMGSIYDSLNVTASDYSVYFRLTGRFLDDFA